MEEWDAAVQPVWWWTCRCPQVHSIQVTYALAEAVTQGSTGVFKIFDGLEDRPPCRCPHTFVFGPTRAEIRSCLIESRIPPSVHYSFVPVWTYSGPIASLSPLPDRGGIEFSRGRSSLPNLRVMVSNYAEFGEFGAAAMTGWRWNYKWQAQAAIMRHRISMAFKSDRGPGAFNNKSGLPKALFSPFVDRGAVDDDVGPKIDDMSFWEDPRVLSLSSPSYFMNRFEVPG